MATSNNRDVKLGIEIQTAGEGSVARLAAAVRALGKEGDPAAAEFNRLANELDRLSQQAGAVESVQALRVNVEKLAAAETAAAAAAQAASTKYAEQTAVANSLRDAQALARAEVVQASTAYDEMNARLKEAVIEGKASGDTQKQIAVSTRDAKLELVEQGLALQNRNRALVEANLALKTAETAETALGRAFKTTGESAASTLQALQSQAGALNAAQADAAALGAEITDLAAAETRLLESTRATVAEAVRLEASTLESAAAMRALESSALAADKQIEVLTASLRETETAARGYATATEQAAAAGQADTATVQARVRAAEALIASERSLTLAQAELASERDRGRAALVSEAQALVTQQRATEASAASTRELVRDSVALGTTLGTTGAAIGRIGTLAETAFGQVGVRSLQAVEAEVFKTEAAMSLLERSFRAGQISARELERALGAATVKLNLLQVEANSTQALPSSIERIGSGINGLITKFGALGAAIATIGIAGKPLLDAELALQRVTRVLTTVSGSAESAQKQIEFLRRTSQQSGQSFTELAGSYSSFAASASQSGITLAQTQDVFKAVALAAGNLGLSSDQAKRALEALSQIASKGTVAMEELRQQLGDALPGVLPLLSKELGLTQAELIKVISSGQLLASEGIPAIGRALNALAPSTGVVDGIVASFNRFTNVVKEAGVDLAEGPLGKGAAVVLTAFAGVIRDIGVVAVFASEGFDQLGKKFGVVIAALTGGRPAIKGLGDELDRISDESGQRLKSLVDTAYGAEAAFAALGKTGTALGTSFAKLALEQQKAINLADQQSASADILVKAAKDEAKAVEILGAITRDAVAAQGAAVVSSNLLVTAHEAQAKADERVVEVLIASRAATLAKAGADAEALKGVQPQLQALDAKIIKATADAEKTRESADAERAKAAAVTVTTEALRLSSTAVGESAAGFAKLRANVEIAKQAYDAIALAMVADVKGSENAKRAAEALAVAKGVLRNAIDEVTAALQRQLAALQAEAALTVAGIKLEIEKQKNAQLAAEKKADENGARAAGIRVLQLEQQIITVGIGLKVQETDATIKALETRKVELVLADQWTAEKEVEYQIKLKTAQASKLDALATEEANKTKAAEVKVLVETGGARGQYTVALGASTVATNTNTAATNTNTAAVHANAGAVRELSPALAQANADAQRFGITLEKTLPISANAGVTASLQAFERLKLGGVATEAELTQAFVAVATQAIAASKGIVPEWVKVEAVFRNVAIQTDATGASVLKVRTAADLAGTGVNALAASFSAVGTAAEDAAKKIDLFTSANQKARNDTVKSVLGKNTDSSGFATDSNGQRISASTQASIPAGYHFDKQQYDRDAANARSTDRNGGFVDPNDPRYLVPNGTVTPGFVNGQPLAKPGAASGESAALGTPAGVSTTHSINIKINGVTTSGVQTASAADSDALVNIFNQLQSAFRATGGA